LEVFELTMAVAQLFGVHSYFWDDGEVRRVSSLNQEAVRSAPPSEKRLRVSVRAEEGTGGSTGAMLQKVLLHQTRRNYADSQAAMAPANQAVRWYGHIAIIPALSGDPAEPRQMISFSKRLRSLALVM